MQVQDKKIVRGQIEARDLTELVEKLKKLLDQDEIESVSLRIFAIVRHSPKNFFWEDSSFSLDNNNSFKGSCPQPLVEKESPLTTK